MPSHWMLGFGSEGYTIIQTISKWGEEKKISGMWSPIYVKKSKLYMCMHVCIYIFIL